MRVVSVRFFRTIEKLTFFTVVWCKEIQKIVWEIYLSIKLSVPSAAYSVSKIFYLTKLYAKSEHFVLHKLSWAFWKLWKTSFKLSDHFRSGNYRQVFTKMAPNSIFIIFNSQLCLSYYYYYYFETEVSDGAETQYGILHSFYAFPLWDSPFQK